MISALISALIYLLVIGVVAWLAIYILSVIPMPDPFGRVARVVIIVIACLAAILVLLGLVDMRPGLALR
jgi:hypothetical protein